MHCWLLSAYAHARSTDGLRKCLDLKLPSIGISAWLRFFDNSRPLCARKNCLSKLLFAWLCISPRCLHCHCSLNNFGCLNSIGFILIAFPPFPHCFITGKCNLFIFTAARPKASAKITAQIIYFFLPHPEMFRSALQSATASMGPMHLYAST